MLTQQLGQGQSFRSVTSEKALTIKSDCSKEMVNTVSFQLLQTERYSRDQATKQPGDTLEAYCCLEMQLTSTSIHCDSNSTATRMAMC